MDPSPVISPKDLVKEAEAQIKNGALEKASNLLKIVIGRLELSKSSCKELFIAKMILAELLDRNKSQKGFGIGAKLLRQQAEQKMTGSDYDKCRKYASTLFDSEKNAAKDSDLETAKNTFWELDDLAIAQSLRDFSRAQAVEAGILFLWETMDTMGALDDDDDDGLLERIPKSTSQTMPFDLESSGLGYQPTPSAFVMMYAASPGSDVNESSTASSPSNLSSIDFECSPSTGDMSNNSPAGEQTPPQTKIQIRKKTGSAFEFALTVRQRVLTAPLMRLPRRTFFAQNDPENGTFTPSDRKQRGE